MADMKPKAMMMKSTGGLVMPLVDHALYYALIVPITICAQLGTTIQICVETWEV